MKQIQIASSELLLLGGYAYKWKTVDKTVELLTARQMELDKQKKPTTTTTTITATNRKRLRHELESTTETATEVVTKARKMMASDDCKDKPIDILVVADAIREKRRLQESERCYHTFERDLELPGVKRSVQVTCRNIEFKDDGDDIVVKKTSAAKLWKRAWPSEVAKAHVLMFLTRNKTAQFEERTKRGTEVYTKTIDWNDDRWCDITQRLTKAVIRIEDNLKRN